LRVQGQMQVDWKVGCDKGDEELNQDRIWDNKASQRDIVVEETRRDIPEDYEWNWIIVLIQFVCASTFGYLMPHQKAVKVTGFREL